MGRPCTLCSDSTKARRAAEMIGATDQASLTRLALAGCQFNVIGKTTLSHPLRRS
jgi:hypothetical protein